MEDKQYEILLEAINKVGQRIDDLEKVTNDIKNDIGDDRIKINDVILAQENLFGTIKIMREDINNFNKDTKTVVTDAMNDVLQPAVKSVDSLKKEIKNKKTIIISKNKLIDWIKLKLNPENK